MPLTRGFLNARYSISAEFEDQVLVISGLFLCKSLSGSGLQNLCQENRHAFI